jgi:DNA double-strand break repair helicase HerA and related ATPase
VATPAPKAARKSAPRAPKPGKSTAEKVLESTAFRQATRSAAAVLGREITRSIFGTRRR